MKLWPLPDWDIPDSSQNPEVNLMRAEGDEDEADIEESMWDAASHVTKPQLNRFD